MKTPVHSEAYSNPCRKSKMELLAKITNKRPLTIFIKSSILDVGQGSEYVWHFHYWTGVIDFRGVFKTLSNILDGAIWENCQQVNSRLAIFAKSSNLDVWQGLIPSHPSAQKENQILFCACAEVIWSYGDKKTKRSLFKLYLRIYYFHLLFFI